MISPVSWVDEFTPTLALAAYTHPDKVLGVILPLTEITMFSLSKRFYQSNLYPLPQPTMNEGAAENKQARSPTTRSRIAVEWDAISEEELLGTLGYILC